jgi:hypothetical protein
MTVRVYESVRPLRMQPVKGQYGTQEFDTFVDKVFHPLMSGEETGSGSELAPECTGVQPEKPEGTETESSPDSAEVEKVLNKRTVGVQSSIGSSGRVGTTDTTVGEIRVILSVRS